MGRIFLGFSIALRRLIRQPKRTFLIQAGLAGGIATLVATLCMIEGTRLRWSEYSRYTEPTHLTLDGAWALKWKKVRKSKKGTPSKRALEAKVEAAAALMAFQAEFGARLERYDTDGYSFKLYPKREDDLALANDIEVWLLERGTRATPKWRVKGSRTAAILETIRRIGVLFYTAAVLCLLTGAVGLFAIQKAAADQRRVELAVRRIEGATSADIVVMLLAESLGVAVLGLATGIPVGVLSGKVIEHLIEDAGFAFPVGPVVACSLILAALAVLFGLLPAWSAVRSEPSRTLHEA
jgi:predicted lysophospholipase L1 biosynthesis ABC-type transport system permease subunit